MRTVSPLLAGAQALPASRRVAASAPWRWLGAGWRDLRANPLPSLAYGLQFALAGDLILLAALDTPHLAAVAVSGFLLVAPLLAAGLYELSRARERGEALLYIDSWRVFRRHGESLALYGLLALIAALFWERLSAVAFALLAGNADGLSLGALAASANLPLLAAWLTLGGLLAGLVFVLSVVCVPLIIDRDCDVATALAASLHVCRRNPGPLLLWAALLAGLTLLGFATLLCGLIAIMPLLGHASWHAYRDLVE